MNATPAHQRPAPATKRSLPLNFGLAHKIAGFITPGGPRSTDAAKRSAVEEMRYAATAAVDHVFEITQLQAAHNLHDSELLIVDRPTWVKANAQSFGIILGPVADHVFGSKLENLTDTGATVLEVGGSAELGAVLAFLSTRVLGQYDPYAALAGHGAPGGRLMIVAPNLVQLEEELNLDPADFRLWVALHEQTHRVQFAAAPWLRDHMLATMHELAKELGETSENLPERIAAAASGALCGMKNKESLADSAAPVPNGAVAMLSPRGQELMEQTTAIMSLLEGHANVVMDAVDASIVPSIKTIRRRFERRGKNQGFFPRFVGKLLGMDAKMLQYKNGQKFVQHIVDEVGMVRFNRIWEAPENLPTATEITDPQLWINRVLESEAK
ncbi:MAG: zinc-dependent metalloprotease [Rothia sp. (in: high G+C Gram-positive bacteria)]|nr:zinc-dependent metalloprotease [Rothia sp. (in: high G+C Gram-positive bacteria)]